MINTNIPQSHHSPKGRYLAYLRVSTPKQGEGVSLLTQRETIVRFAARKHLRVTGWYEEKETAAKRGRTIFREVLQMLRNRKADGLIVYKVDRSARNLKDWADLGELIDQGIPVYFASDDLDMSSRSGRLAADIQAVVAADFIRNLREEAKRGIRKRLEQGLRPNGAPIGYLDQGNGKPKEIDPEKGPLVRLRVHLVRDRGLHASETLLAPLRSRTPQPAWSFDRSERTLAPTPQSVLHRVPRCPSNGRVTPRRAPAACRPQALLRRAGEAQDQALAACPQTPVQVQPVTPVHDVREVPRGVAREGTCLLPLCDDDLSDGECAGGPDNFKRNAVSSRSLGTTSLLRDWLAGASSKARLRRTSAQEIR